MLTSPDFAKKQIVFVFFNDGEKMSFSNDNLVVKDKDGKVKLQCTCYRLFMVFAIGHTSITSALIQKAKKFGFFIALMTPGFRLYALIGDGKDGNILLKKKQYSYEGLGLAKHITANKMQNQRNQIMAVRNKSESQKDAAGQIEEYILKISDCKNLNEIMAYEGLASKIYFKNYSNNLLWTGRKPRIKHDYISLNGAPVADIGWCAALVKTGLKPSFRIHEQ